MTGFSNQRLLSVAAITLAAVICVHTFGCRHSIAENEEIQIAVISQAISEREEPSSLYFLSLGPQRLDPNPTFLARIQQSNPLVRLGSSTSETPPFLEKGSGRQGVAIWVGEARFSSFGKATVEISIRAGFLAGGGSEIYLKKIRGQWQVVGGKPTWVS